MADTLTQHQQILTIFETNLNLDVPSVETDLIGSGLLDSMGLVELLVSLEQQFSVNISLDKLELDHFRSIESIASLIATLMA